MSSQAQVQSAALVLFLFFVFRLFIALVDTFPVSWLGLDGGFRVLLGCHDGMRMCCKDLFFLSCWAGQQPSTHLACKWEWNNASLVHAYARIFKSM